MYDFNSKSVEATLEQVVMILNEHRIKNLFIGSVVIAAINGKLHRKLGDLDLIVDSKKADILYKELAKLGYSRAKGMFSFGRKYLSLETLDSPSLLGVGYFHGEFRDDGSFVMGNKRINVEIDPSAIIETRYKLLGQHFMGIPESAAATGVMTSSTNPKRKKELVLLKERNITPLPNNYIHVNFFGMRIDWVYHLTMLILNVIGSIRVKMGLAFDPWR